MSAPLRVGQLEFAVAEGCHDPVLDALLADAAATGTCAFDPGELRLVVEEVLTNVVKYSGAAGTGLPARVRWAMSPTELMLEFEDPGQPFDPLAEDEADRSDDERCEGGMGILLVQALADTIRYSRQDGLNRLELTFRAA